MTNFWLIRIQSICKNNSNMAHIVQFVLESEGKNNILWKEENACSPFQTRFTKGFLYGVINPLWNNKMLD